MQLRGIAVVVGAIVALGGGVAGQLDQRPFGGSPDHPAIEYATRPTRDPVAALNRLIDAGEVQLQWEITGDSRVVLNPRPCDTVPASNAETAATAEKSCLCELCVLCG